MKLGTVLLGIIAAGAIVVAVTGCIIWFISSSSSSEERRVYKAAVVTNGYECAGIGTSILEKGGNAIEAAIAALFCEGIAMPQSMGLGGGFLMVFYNRSEEKVYSLNARETAPAAATKDMFNGNKTQSERGGRAVAVPGDLLGYWRLYERFGGNLPWAELVQPTIDLCKQGVYVTSYLASVFASRQELLYADPVLRDIFIDPATNLTWKEGQRVKRKRLAKTLEIIAREGGLAIHNGSLTEKIIKDIKAHGGIMTKEDLQNYKPIFSEPTTTQMKDEMVLYSSPLPGSGLILGYILNILSGFIDTKDPNSVVTNQRIVESFKWGYARRSELGDPAFQDLSEFITNLESPEYAKKTREEINDTWTSNDAEYYGVNVSSVEDHGTANLCVMDEEGNAVTVTSTINFIFGAGFASDSTGIIMNDEMDDFSMPGSDNGFDVPPSPSNFIAPGKRPLSSMVPSLVVNAHKDIVMAIGGAGGTKITTGVALTIIKHLWFGMDLKSAIDEKRLHHQLLPMLIVFDPEYDTEAPNLVEGLHKIGHNYSLGDNDGFCAVTSISKFQSGNALASDSIVAAYDKRRKGATSYL